MNIYQNIPNEYDNGKPCADREAKIKRLVLAARTMTDPTAEEEQEYLEALKEFEGEYE